MTENLPKNVRSYLDPARAEYQHHVSTDFHAGAPVAPTFARFAVGQPYFVRQPFNEELDTRFCGIKAAEAYASMLMENIKYPGVRHSEFHNPEFVRKCISAGLMKNARYYRIQDLGAANTSMYDEIRGRMSTSIRYDMITACVEQRFESQAATYLFLRELGKDARGEFSNEEMKKVAEIRDLGYRTITNHVKLLVEAGWVKKTAHGKYRVVATSKLVARHRSRASCRRIVTSLESLTKPRELFFAIVASATSQSNSRYTQAIAAPAHPEIAQQTSDTEELKGQRELRIGLLSAATRRSTRSTMYRLSKTEKAGFLTRTRTVDYVELVDADQARHRMAELKYGVGKNMLVVNPAGRGGSLYAPSKVRRPAPQQQGGLKSRKLRVTRAKRQMLLISPGPSLVRLNNAAIFCHEKQAIWYRDEAQKEAFLASRMTVKRDLPAYEAPSLGLPIRPERIRMTAGIPGSAPQPSSQPLVTGLCKKYKKAYASLLSANSRASQDFGLPGKCPPGPESARACN